MKVHKANGLFVELTKENWSEVIKNEPIEKVSVWKMALHKEQVRAENKAKVVPVKEKVAKEPVKDEITEETKTFKEKITAAVKPKKKAGRKKKYKE